MSEYRGDVPTVTFTITELSPQVCSSHISKKNRERKRNRVEFYILEWWDLTVNLIQEFADETGVLSSLTAHCVSISVSNGLEITCLILQPFFPV